MGDDPTMPGRNEKALAKIDEETAHADALDQAADGARATAKLFAAAGLQQLADDFDRAADAARDQATDERLKIAGKWEAYDEAKGAPTRDVANARIQNLVQKEKDSAEQEIALGSAELPAALALGDAAKIAAAVEHFANASKTWKKIFGKYEILGGY